MATYPTLGMNRNNDKNEVTRLQEALIKEGFSVGSTGADGIYGPKTAQAVQAYQQKNQLQVDGIAGPQTLGHLYSQSAQETAPAVQDTTPTAQPQPAPSAVETARTALDQHMQNKPAQTDSQWKKALDDLYEQITNQGDFTYDVNADALYQQYRDLYTAQGNLAMQDTMAQASALTGGYGNSYAQAVGQQAYNSYLQQLNAVVPELYGMAYDRYNQAQQDLYNQASLAATLYDQEFNAYRTALSDWQTERAYLMDADNTAYSRQQDAKNELLTLMTTTGYTPTDEELAATGMTRAQAQAWGSYYSGNTGTSQGTSQTGRGGVAVNYDNGDLIEEEIADLQNALGITADGKWGPESQKKAKEKWGVTTAAEAMVEFIMDEVEEKHKSKKIPSGDWYKYAEMLSDYTEEDVLQARGFTKLRGGGGTSVDSRIGGTELFLK